MFARYKLIAAMLIALLTISLLSACGPSPTPEVTATPESQAPTQPVVSAPVECEIAVSAEQGLEYQEEGLPFVYIPPDALGQDTTLHIEQLDAAPQQPDTQLAGPAFDITLADGSLRAPIEIALPLTLSDVDLTEGEVFAAYYEDDVGWIALPSWLSEDGQKVHTTLDHLTRVGSFFSLFPQRPRINLKQATPNPFTNVGWPPCFKDDLTVRVDAYDPDGKVQKVEIMFRFHTFGSELVTIGTEFVQAINGLGLVIMAGDITAAMPAAQTIVTLATTKDPGIVASQWADMGEDPDHPGVYYASMDLSRLSTCEDYFDVDVTMTGTGIEKIVAEIKVTDNSGRIKKDRIEIYVYSGEPAHAVLFEPGPSKDDIQGPRPTFHWEIKGYGSYAARLVYAKGNSLWERWWGKKIIPLKWTDQRWQPDKDLKPGEYVWGVEVSSDEWFRPENTIRSSVYHFTVKRGITDEPTSTSTPRLPPTPTSIPTLLPTPTSTSSPIPVSTSTPTPTPTPQENLVKIPNVVGLTPDEAESKLKEAGFGVLPGKDGYSDDVPTGYIYKQEPEPGKLYDPKNTVVIIYRNRGIPVTTPTPTPMENLVKIPDVVGLTPDEAESKLKEAGFGVLPGKDGYSDDVPAGYIYRQEPRAGELYDPKNTVVIIYRNRGRPTPAMPTPTDTPVPPPAEPTGGGHIAFQSHRDGNNEIYVMNADGSEQTNLTNSPANDWAPSWSPDGTRFTFHSDQDEPNPIDQCFPNCNYEIYVMNANGSGLTRLTDNPAHDWFPSWSPDGTRIAFSSDRDGNDEIYVMNADGSGLTRLTDNPRGDTWPIWSPDGTRIAFTSQRDGNPEIYVMNADGSGQIRMTEHPEADECPAWSPDGMRIAFDSWRDGTLDIYVMNADGSGLRNLTNSPAWDQDSCWSPDGTHIAFVSDRDGNREIYVMNADGSGQTRLTNSPGGDWSPSWSPR